MNKRIWIFQYAKDVRRLGTDQASWYVGWYDLGGKRHCESCGAGSRGRNLAEKRQRRIQSELDTGVHRPRARKSWEAFREEYEAQILAGLAVQSRGAAKAALDSFERLVSPKRVDAVNTQAIDTFVALRRKEQGKKPGSLVSPATINKDLRHIKAALRLATEWGYLSGIPKVRMVREPEKLPRFVTPEHFALIYTRCCEVAQLPQNPGQVYTPATWWRSLVVIAYMTGMRISEILSLGARTLICKQDNS